MTTKVTMAEVLADLHTPSPYQGWDTFPEGCSGLKNGLRLYLEKGIEAGSGLMSVLEGDLWRAVHVLDSQNWTHLRELCEWLYNNPPSIAYGNKDYVKKWISHRGAEGYEDRE